MKVQRDGRYFTVDVAADGESLVSHASAVLLGEVADRVGVTRELSGALAGVRERRGRHDPGRVVRGLAVMLSLDGLCPPSPDGDNPRFMQEIRISPPQRRRRA